MTEAEFLACEDPAVVLEWATRVLPTYEPHTGTPNKLAAPSDRKLRLFAIASAHMNHHSWDPEQAREAFSAAEAIANQGEDSLSPQEWMTLDEAVTAQGLWCLITGTGHYAANFWCRCGDRSESFQATQVSLLRDIIGNPFRPVTLPPGPAMNCGKCHGSGNGPLISSEGHGAHGKSVFAKCKPCKGKGTVPGPSPVLTPQVLSLAQAAYEERLPDGTLNPHRLGVLSDALEEAGLGMEWQDCPRCTPGRAEAKLMPGYHFERDVASGWTNCKTCNGGGQGEQRPGLVLASHPVLSHLRSPGPHVRGCWALDLVLAKE